MSEGLADPVKVAKLLQRENVIPAEVVTSIARNPSPSEQMKALLTSIQDAVSNDYQNLLIFSTVLENVAGNESLANDILIDYSKYNYITILYYNNY